MRQTVVSDTERLRTLTNDWDACPEQPDNRYRDEGPDGPGTIFMRAPETVPPLYKDLYTWLGLSELEWKLMRGGAKCSLRAGADYDVGWSYIGQQTITMTVVHRYQAPGLAVLTCDDGLYVQAHWAKVTAIKVSKLTNAPYP